MLKDRLARLEKAARPEGPQQWRYFRYEAGVYTPSDYRDGGEPTGAPMTAAAFEQWRRDNPGVGCVIEEVVGWKVPTGGVTVKMVSGVSYSDL